MTNTIGTAQKSQKEMPKMHKKVKRGDLGRRTAAGKIMALKWQDKKVVGMLYTTHHEVKIVSTHKKDWKTNEDIMKPEIVVDYNRYKVLSTSPI